MEWVLEFREATLRYITSIPDCTLPLVLVYVADCRRLDRGPDINSGLDFRFNLRPTNKGIYFRSIFFFLFIYSGNELISSLMISFLQ